jgi:ribosome maturation factor RimP
MTPPPDLTRQVRDEIMRLGYELVDLRVAGPPQRRSLRVRIDLPGGPRGIGVTSEDCTQVSRALLAWYPEAIAGERLDALEVSSPGVERPIRWPEHWRRYQGSRVRVRAAGVAGKPAAWIREVPDDEHVRLEFEDGSERTLALADIVEATLVVEWPVGRKR